MREQFEKAFPEKSIFEYVDYDHECNMYGLKKHVTEQDAIGLFAAIANLNGAWWAWSYQQKEIERLRHRISTQTSRSHELLKECDELQEEIAGLREEIAGYPIPYDEYPDEMSKTLVGQEYDSLKGTKGFFRAMPREVGESIMNKLQMAHEYAMQHLENSGGKITMHSLCLFAWEYADAMQAEADKRSISLTKDKDGNCLHFHHEFGHQKCMDCGSSLNHLNSVGVDIQGVLHSIDTYFDQADSSKTQRMADNLIAEIYEKLSGEVSIDHRD